MLVETSDIIKDSAEQLQLVNREEIWNLITNELVDLFPLSDWFCKLLDPSCNETKYFHWIDAGLNKCYQKRLNSAVAVGQ